MTMTVSGNGGITFSNITNTPTASVTAKFSPNATGNTVTNIVTIDNCRINGTNGFTINGTTYTTAP